MICAPSNAALDTVADRLVSQINDFELKNDILLRVGGTSFVPTKILQKHSLDFKLDALGP